MLQIDSSYEQLKRTDIKEAERELSVEFPPEYIEFLMRLNLIKDSWSMLLRITSF